MEPTSSRSLKPLVSLREFADGDLPHLQEWMKARGIAYPLMCDLPKLGLVCSMNMGDGALASIPLAMGFLVETDTNTAIIEYFGSNPDATKEIRDVAIDTVCTALEAAAKVRGYSRLKCDTQLDTIKQRALKHGCTPVGDFSVFLKGL